MVAPRSSVGQAARRAAAANVTSLNPIEASGFAVGAVAQKIVGFAIRPSWTDQAKRLAPGVVGHLFEVAVVEHRLNARRTGAVVLCKIRVDGTPKVDQRGPRLADAG